MIQNYVLGLDNLRRNPAVKGRAIVKTSAKCQNRIRFSCLRYLQFVHQKDSPKDKEQKINYFSQ